MSVGSSCLTQGQLSANKASGLSDGKINQLCIMQAQGAVTCEGVLFHFIHSSALPNSLGPKLRNAILLLLF